jgi:anti-sigma regulatory factor (Ser/Thr protein kinase)/PAS domain-containing protein
MGRIVLIFFFLLITLPIRALPVDLTEEDVYVRRGFDASHTLELAKGAGWVRIPGVETGQRRLLVKNIDLPGVPERHFLSPRRYPAGEFTFQTSFSLHESVDYIRNPLALFIGHIGLNWEIYLNGVLIHSETHPGPDMQPERIVNGYNLVVPLPSDVLRYKNNVLTFRIIGDPTLQFTGFERQQYYLVEELADALKRESENSALIFNFIYLFIGIYFLFLFLRRPVERYNLFFSLLAVCLFIYFFSRTHLVYELVPSSLFIKKMEYVSLFMIMPLTVLFFDSILDRGQNLMSRLIIIINGIFALLVIPFPLGFCHDLLRVWQVTALVVLLPYVAVGIVGYHFFKELRFRLEGSGRSVRGFLRNLGITLRDTVPGNLFIGAILLAFSTVFDILDAIFWSYNIILSQYAFFAFVIGIVLVLSNRFLYIHGRIEELNRDLEDKIEDLKVSNELLALSEERYRFIIEGTTEMVFSLDERLRFITVNRSMKQTLRIEEEVEDLYQLVFFSDSPDGISRESFEESIALLKNQDEPMVITLPLKTRFLNEPMHVRLRMEYIRQEGKGEIIGNAFPGDEDRLLRYFVREKQAYRLDNYLSLADDLSHRITRNMIRYFPRKRVNQARVALREILLNAIEHGNLGITFDEKTRAQENGTYLELVELRQREGRGRGKYVNVEFQLEEEMIRFIIEDDGDGFDHRGLVDKGNRANVEMLYHGRGLVMALNVFDRMEFNEQGNRVTLEMERR